MRLTGLSCLFVMAGSSCAFAQHSGDSGNTSSEVTEYAEGRSSESASGLGSERGGGPRITFGVRGTYAFEADGDGNDTDVSVWRIASRLGISNRVSDRMTISFNFDNETSGYDFSGFDSVVAGAEDDPFDEFHEQSISLSVIYQIDDRWVFFAAPGINAGYEGGADFGESITYGGIAAVGYQVTDSLRIGGGVAISSELEDDVQVLPVISIDWQIDDKWRLTNDDRLRFINEQIGLNLLYAHSDSVSALIGFGYRSREYRLSDDNTASVDGILSDDRFVLSGGLQWNFGRTGSLRVGGGVVLDQEFELDDSSGDEVSDIETDPTGFLGARVVLNF